jgi:hypothetical protein
MKFILLSIAIGGVPTQLGIYHDLKSCQVAIRQIYLRQAMPAGVELSSDIKRQIEGAVDMQLKYDQRYLCQPQKTE